MLKSIEGNFNNPEVNELLTKHFIELRAASPEGSAHVLDIPGLKDKSIKFWSLWQDEMLMGCGALKFLEKNHGEFKSIRVADNFRKLGIGEKIIEPGDLLCRGSRPEYQTLAERRSQIGVGARTHCDIVIKLDLEKKRILLIGGNVLAWVSLKILPADFSNDGFLIPAPYNGRRLFAHLKLQADEVESSVFENSPSVQELLCSGYDFYSLGIIDESSAKCMAQAKD